ncbi:hypothetical protein MJG53_017274 [Ovis ammon polii x Ovis aries]|uniref:Uncharacterized protein n=2 Tax=Ovis TaxID=9935 RepID=A0A836CS22_SHEEP|nr:hypothetical protein JEQ12_010356 [Ovis aries]KAI4560645.1 hypothetical protein MJG53_017274 [Ovis ammon polii x Ovis aries]
MEDEESRPSGGRDGAAKPVVLAQVTDSSTFLPASGMTCLENGEDSTWSLLPAVIRLFEFSNSTKRT